MNASHNATVIEYANNLVYLISLVKRLNSTQEKSILCGGQSFSQGYSSLFYVYIEIPNPERPKGSIPQALNPINLNPNPKPQIHVPNPKTTINEQKTEKNVKNNPPKNIAYREPKLLT